MAPVKYIMAGGLIDGSGAPAHRNVCLAVKNGIISAIGPAAGFSPGAGEEVVDLSQYTIVPPLVDGSVSLARSPSVDPKVRLIAEEAGLAEKAALVARHVRYCFEHGVLGAAETSDPLGLAAQVRETRPEVPRVSILTAGRDFLRVVYSDDMGGGEDIEPVTGSEELLRALKRKDGRKAVVVVNGVQRVAEALEAGCDAIEQGYGMGEENLRKMAEKDILWIPSVLVARNGVDGAASGGEVMCRFSMRYVGPGKADPGAETFWKKMLTGQLAQLRLAKKMGVRTAAGTGAGSVGILHGESMVEEIKLFMKGGYSLEEAVRSCSVNGARFFGMEELGELAPGRPATFLVARGTVRQLPRKLAFLENIYIDGEARL